ncbi:MAG TPA: hypothetical protein VEN81_06880, partial [Planctomycetota bacterium]|nr:hypothetical protein [Planctomycetota bacterium]
MDRARALWYAFLGVWVFLLAWHGGVSVPATAIATGALAVLNVLAGRLLGEPVRLSGAGAGFLGILAGLF